MAAPAFQAQEEGPMIGVRDFLKAVTGTWEGLYSGDPDDPGNYANGRLVGSMRGVTAAVLAKHRGVPLDTITADVIKSVTLDEAADIGVELFYKAPHLDLLTWSAPVAELLDFGWGAGAGQAVKSLQRLIGADADGVLGPLTAARFNGWLESQPEAGAAQAIYDMRIAFYRQIATTNPTLQKYLTGWKNRAQWALKAAA
jgi:lysozyme family protein